MRCVYDRGIRNEKKLFNLKLIDWLFSSILSIIIFTDYIYIYLKFTDAIIKFIYIFFK